MTARDDIARLALAIEREGRIPLEWAIAHVGRERDVLREAWDCCDDAAAMLRLLKVARALDNASVDALLRAGVPIRAFESAMLPRHRAVTDIIACDAIRRLSPAPTLEQLAT